MHAPSTHAADIDVDPPEPPDPDEELPPDDGTHGASVPSLVRQSIEPALFFATSAPHHSPIALTGAPLPPSPVIGGQHHAHAAASTAGRAARRREQPSHNHSGAATSCGEGGAAGAAITQRTTRARGTHLAQPCGAHHNHVGAHLNKCALCA